MLTFRIPGERRERGFSGMGLTGLTAATNRFEEFVRHLARGRVDQARADLRQLAADLAPARRSATRSRRPRRRASTLALPLAKPATPPVPSPVIV